MQFFMNSDAPFVMGLFVWFNYLKKDAFLLRFKIINYLSATP